MVQCACSELQLVGAVNSCSQGNTNQEAEKVNPEHDWAIMSHKVQPQATLAPARFHALSTSQKCANSWGPDIKLISLWVHFILNQYSIYSLSKSIGFIHYLFIHQQYYLLPLLLYLLPFSPVTFLLPNHLH